MAAKPTSTAAAAIAQVAKMAAAVRRLRIVYPTTAVEVAASLVTMD
jgi:hypothetical protein